LTCPKEVRDYLGLRPGDAVEFRIVDARVVVEPVETNRAWEVGKNLFGKYASGRSDLSTDRKRILQEKLRARRAR
jgi:RHH-type rel operon transcriptional repressor/antitoxin RelB